MDLIRFMANEKIIALVTGGNNGVGFETCSLIASQPNFHVIMGSRSLEKGQAALAKIQTLKPAGSISLVQLDVTSDASIHAARDDIESKQGRVDVLINNAGICPLTFDRAVMREVLETNTISPGLVTEVFLPLLKAASHSRVIYVSSRLGSLKMRSDPQDHARNGDYKAYRISKTALNMVAVCDAWQYQKDGVKVFVYCPGFVQSDLAGMRQKKVEMGVPTAEGSARGLLEIAEGKRDGDAAKFLHNGGGDNLHPW